MKSKNAKTKIRTKNKNSSLKSGNSNAGNPIEDSDFFRLSVQQNGLPKLPPKIEETPVALLEVSTASPNLDTNYLIKKDTMSINEKLEEQFPISKSKISGPGSIKKPSNNMVIRTSRSNTGEVQFSFKSHRDKASIKTSADTDHTHRLKLFCKQLIEKFSFYHRHACFHSLMLLLKLLYKSLESAPNLISPAEVSMIMGDWMKKQSKSILNDQKVITTLLIYAKTKLSGQSEISIEDEFILEKGNDLLLEMNISLLF